MATAIATVTSAATVTPVAAATAIRQLDVDHPAPPESSPPSALASTTNPDPLLDAKQFAAYLGITPRHARDLIDQRKVTIVRIGRRIRVRRSEAELMIRQYTVPAQRDSRPWGVRA